MIAVSSRCVKLELVFSFRDGQTFLSSQFAQSPLKIWRPFDVGPGRVLVQLVNVSPGLMQGDDYNLRIILEPGAKVVLVNQSASKIHQMREGQAKQSVHITLAEDAELEYYPGLTIPFPEANYEQEIKIDMTSGAKLALLERWATGRVARGESYLFHSLCSQLRLYRDSQLVYADCTILKRDTGMLDANTYLASGVWVWDSIPGAEAVPEDMVLITGQSIKQVGYVRGMARDGLKMQQALDTMLLNWRKQQGLEDIVFSRFMS